MRGVGWKVTRLVVVDRLLVRDRHVGHGEEFLRHRDGERNAGLEGRLVPAREDAARVGGLELARNHPLAARRGRVIDHEEAAAEPVDAARIGDGKLVAAGADRARKHERRVSAAASSVSAAPARSPSIAALRTCVSTALRTSLPVGSRTSISTTLGAREGKLVEIGLEVEGIMDGHHGLGQLARRRGECKHRLGRARCRKPTAWTRGGQRSTPQRGSAT